MDGEDPSGDLQVPASRCFFFGGKVASFLVFFLGVVVAGEIKVRVQGEEMQENTTGPTKSSLRKKMEVQGPERVIQTKSQGGR